MKYIATIEGQQVEIEINTENEIIIGDQTFEVDFQSVADQPIYSMILDGASYEASIFVTDTGLQVLLQGHLEPPVVQWFEQAVIRSESQPTACTVENDVHDDWNTDGLGMDLDLLQDLPRLCLWQHDSDDNRCWSGLADVA